MKIALLTDGIYPYVIGGMQKHSYFLAKYLARNKINVDLYHFKSIDNYNLPNPFNAEELLFIKTFEIDYPSTIWFPGHYLYKRYLYSKKVLRVFLLENRKYDFVYAKGFSAWALLNKRKKHKLKIPVGLNFHGYEMFQRWPSVISGLKLQILKYPVLYNMRKADHLFSYGAKISKIIERKVSKNKLIEIPSGVDKKWITSKIKPSSQQLNFVFVGRAERRKGIIEINKTIKSIDKNFNANFHFIGPIEPNLKIFDSRVKYHGTIYDSEDLKFILDQMDILLCPSYSEGMPNVIMEAMSRGLAIIATDVGAVSKLVDEENGWLINPRGLEKNLNSSIVRAIKTECNEIDKKKKRSLNKIKFFTWEKVILQLINRIKSE